MGTFFKSTFTAPDNMDVWSYAPDVGPTGSPFWLGLTTLTGGIPNSNVILDGQFVRGDSTPGNRGLVGMTVAGNRQTTFVTPVSSIESALSLKVDLD
ncbi:MAG: hypothetical protein U0798_15050 [Gemmataceae bacterium]